MGAGAARGPGTSGGESEPAAQPKKAAGKGKKPAPRDVEPDESGGSAPSDTEE